MSKPEQTRQVVAAYFNAWTTKDTTAAYDLLADDLEFIGPSAHFRSRQDFKPGLEGFAALTKWARIIDFLVDGDRAALLYECELPEPAGVMRISSFFRVVGEKIQTYETQFDADGFRQLMARLQEGR